MPGHLIKLEIRDFKSYSGLHVIGFSKFAAIIGPNGCGMYFYRNLSNVVANILLY